MQGTGAGAGNGLVDAVESTRVDVCVCSHRRREIVDTLRGIAGQSGISGVDLRVIVADNTAAAEMRDVVADAARSLGLELCYVHAPADNISIARNACLGAAQAPWIAFLDDDELPAPGWLAALLAEAARDDWSAVLGPVLPIYPDNMPRWLRGGDFHTQVPVPKQGRIVTGYTGNVLFRRAVTDGLGLRFRIELGKSGGEDEDFFDRLFRAGGRIGFAPEATVYEHVPPSRMRMGWLLRRSFRSGQTHGTRLMRDGAWIGNMAVASAKAGICGGAAALWAAVPARRNRFLVRAALHAGVVARLSGLLPITTY